MKPVFSKKFKKTMQRKKPVPLWVPLSLIVLVILLLTAVITMALNVFVSSEREDAVKDYQREKERQSLIERDLDDLKEWGMKNAIIMGVYGAPTAFFVLCVVLILHGFKVVGR